MTSLINPLNIDSTFPVAGQDNDTQGFRDNFTNIQNNFSVAANEITTLQAGVTQAGNLTISGNINQQYQLANVSTGASSNVTINSNSSVTILDNSTPGGATLTSANIFFPDNSALTDGQILTVSSNCAITTVAFYPGPGYKINGNPTSYTANQTYQWLYSKITNSWYRI
jgi:hypothetical protein